MIHTKYDFYGAVESARNAVKRTGKARYVVCQAIGYDIVSKRPKNVVYEAWRVLKTGLKAVPYGR